MRNHMHSANSSAAAAPTNTSGQTASGDATYDSQLSLDTNPDAFSRDAIGRRSMSEKHHAALDAKETGTYQRNKKAREQRELQQQQQQQQRDSDRRVAHFRKGTGSGGGNANLSGNGLSLGSMESLTSNSRAAAVLAATASTTAAEAAASLANEALDRVGELGPSLGLKKSSSLESLQTMVQEIQMADEPHRGPNALRTPRGRGREESLRAAVENPLSIARTEPRKHWLAEDGPSDTEGGFINRHGPFQGSLNEGKLKSATATALSSHQSSAAARAKKPGFMKGISHMFRFGKHRKDGIAPSETYSDLGPAAQHQTQQQPQAQPIYQTRSAAMAVPIGAANQQQQSDRRPVGGPPNYQPPPPVGGSALHPHDPTFSQRYAQSVYVNHGDLQQQIG